MSARRIALTAAIPLEIRRVFNQADECATEEEELFREVAARAVFDALGYTGHSEPDKHRAAVREARLWFKYEPYAEVVFSNGGILFEGMRESIAGTPALEKTSRKKKLEK
jgi:hypothetical protein